MIPITSELYAVLAEIAIREAGLYLPESKRAFVLSRLQRRLRHHGMRDFGRYVTLLRSATESGSAEREAFVSALTTNVTEVFREAHHFGILAEHLDRWRGDRLVGCSRFRIWSAGCASGEEPLSIAATCRAVLGPAWRTSVRILATDVDRAMIDRARDRGPTSDPAMAARLARLPDSVMAYARSGSEVAHGGTDDLQKGIKFVRHNILDPLPCPEAFDVIFCRNVTIYFSPDARNSVHARLRSRLAPGGLLAIGHSERLHGPGSDLAAIGRTAFRSPDASPRHARAEPRPCC